MKVISGPQDLPKINAETLYNSIYELVPNACLFTVMPVLEQKQIHRSSERVMTTELVTGPEQVTTTEPATDPEQVLTTEPATDSEQV